MRIRLLLLAALAAAAACESPSAPSETPGTPGLRFVSTPSASDTIDAPLSAPLVVEVRGSDGKPLPGLVVALTGLGRAAQPAEVRLATAPGSPAQSELRLTTGADGRVSAWVVMAGRAGRAVVRVSTDTPAYADSVAFTVLPGAPARVIASPADTAILAGGTVPLRAAVQDRYGNTASGTATFTSLSSHLAVAGNTATGVSIGRAQALATLGALHDTAYVSVVPDAMLAAQSGGKIVMLRSDGTGLRTLYTPAAGTGSPAGPQWMPDGSGVVFAHDNALWFADTNGAAHTVFTGAPPVDAEYAPQVSRDGAWIYFTRGFTGSQHTAWRVHPDGTGAEQVSEVLDWGLEVSPSPEPGGTHMAYASNRDTNSPLDFGIRTIDLATGTVSALVLGASPHWSPAGGWIAYNAKDGTPHRMHGDGSADQQVGVGIGAHPQFSWSPDGAWLAISGNQPRRTATFGIGMSLVNVSTGEVLPLVFNADFAQPSWR